ncbi:MAG: aquaporin family protein [Hyphomicrobium sp.]|nr:aquaporin family protein [Hyphomicrobium sp.]
MQDKIKIKPVAASDPRAPPDLNRQLFAEFLGTLILVATVVGSGIMGAKLAGGNTAIALLGNTIPTGAILVVLISILGPVSGAHFNPVVTLVMRLRGEIASGVVPGYIVAQIAGGSLGAVLANAMFDLPALQISTTMRGGTGQWIAEVVATFGLLGTILGAVRYKPDAVPVLVGLYITAAYWFTASTSFANPAVSIARMFSDTFAGISPGSVPAFIAMQIVGALLGHWVFGWLFQKK